MRFLTSLILCVLLISSAWVGQASPPPLSPIQECLNLGNMLEAPREGEWGLRVQRDYLPIIAAAGFDTVRIPIRWSAHAEEQAPYTLDPAFFARIDEVVGWALASDLQVVLNIHHYEAIMTDPEAHFPRLLALWLQIAEHYASYPNTVMFELLNEPNNSLTPALWNSWLAQLLAVVRVSNPTRMVIVGGGQWNSLPGLQELTLPDDPHLIATFHYYEPFQFTHQGAEWVTDMTGVSGVGWGTQAERAQVKADMQAAAAWGVEQGVPILLGEFGAYGRVAEPAARIEWTEAVRQEAEAAGLGWCYWEFASGFGVYDPVAREFRSDLYGALIPENE